ncbi:hypothetical protein PMAC_002750 [Pneumocystis sp. 'macacae']|nr:hypothetical protein PMAC_002750 [Pneumocystis sp. 'macacae']
MSMDGLIKESELLVAKLETAPTLNALEAYIQQLQHAEQQLRDCTDNASALSTWTTILPALQRTITQVSEAQREVQTAIQRYGRVLDKQFRTDLTGIHVHEEFPGEPEWLHYTIGMHLVRQAAFGMAKTFMKETNIDLPTDLLQAFQQLYRILDALRNQDFQTAIEWTFSKRALLEQRGSNLEFDLHKLQFISIFIRSSKGNHMEAIEYARTHFPPFANKYLKGLSLIKILLEFTVFYWILFDFEKLFGSFNTNKYFTEIKQLMCLFCYTSNMQLFPYKELCEHEHLWTSVQALFSREYCSLFGLAPDSPLQTVSIAGSLAIPTLLKMSSIMKEKKTEWTSRNELPVEIPLPSKYQFHSVFTCPISKEQTTELNPPLMIPCGHVISKNSIERLSKDNPTNKFKCPYCPRETTQQEAIMLYL